MLTTKIIVIMIFIIFLILINFIFVHLVITIHNTIKFITTK